MTRYSLARIGKRLCVSLLVASLATAPPFADAPPQGGVAVPAPQPRYSHPELSMETLEAREASGAHMQSTGFGLLMGGIGVTGIGVIMMVKGLSEVKRETDPYTHYTTTSDLPVLFWAGDLIAGTGATLLTVGIVLNRIGHGKRDRYQRLIDERSHVSLGVGVNSLRLSYTF